MTQMLDKKAWGQPTTWGQALFLKTHGGLRQYVSTINRVVNSPSRPVFAKLFTVGDPAELVKDQPFYAWLLLTVMGENPGDWGISDSAVPEGVSVRHLKKVLRTAVRHTGLEPVTRWFEVTDNFVEPVGAAA